MRYTYFLLAIIIVQLLPSCVMEDRGGGQYVIRAKTGEEYRREGEFKQRVEEYSHPTGNAPSVAGKTYKLIPDGRMLSAMVKFLPSGKLSYTESGRNGLNSAGGQWKQDRNALGFQVEAPNTPTYLGRIRGEHYEGVVGNRSGYAGNFKGVTGSALNANERAAEEQARRDLVRLHNQVESVKGFFRDALSTPPSGGGGSGGDSGTQGSRRSFTSSGYNDMTVTYDKLANTAPVRGTNTIHVTLDGHGYSITYNFYPGSYMCHGGDLTGQTVNVKFSGGAPVSVKNFNGGEGYVTVAGWSRL